MFEYTFAETKFSLCGVSSTEALRARRMKSNPHDEPWKACYRELAPKLLLYARQWVFAVTDAQDIVQIAFVKFWRHRPTAGADDYPLLYAAVRSTALDWLRSNARRLRREIDPAVEVVRDDSPYFDSSIEQNDDAQLVEGALQKLSPEQREVVVLRVWGGLTFSQIATTLGESINTVASRHRYGIGALRRILKTHEPERLRA